MLISPSVTAGKNGVKSERFLLARKYWLNPQIARTALMRTIAGLSADSPLTVASTKRVIAGFEIWPGNFEAIHKQRPSKKGDTANWIKNTYNSGSRQFCQEFTASKRFSCPTQKRRVQIRQWKAILGHYLPGPTFCLFASMTEVKFEGLPWPQKWRYWVEKS